MQLATCFIVVLISLEIICRSQGHIHANPPKNEGKVPFSGMSYNKNPIEWFDIQSGRAFYSFLAFTFEICSKLVYVRKYVRNSYNTRPDYMSNHSIRYIYSPCYPRNIFRPNFLILNWCMFIENLHKCFPNFPHTIWTCSKKVHSKNRCV